MKKFIYIILLSVSFAPMAQAADKSTDVNSSGYAVEKIICRPAMIHTPSSDVSYKPSVDVNGNAVAPADLNAAPPISGVSEYTEVPLNIDLAKKLNLSQPAEMMANYGSLKIYDTGRVVYNGQDITSNANVLCGRTGADAIPPGPAPVETPRVVNTPPAASDVPVPGSLAPSATTPAR